MVTKFLKIENPRRGYYTHEDQNKDGLRFRTITHAHGHVTLMISGDSDKVDAYINREKATVLSDDDMKAQYDEDIPVKVYDCPMCGASNAIVIPEFNATKAKKLLEDYNDGTINNS